MEQHKTFLDETCRTCGCHKDVFPSDRKPRNKSEFAKEIQVLSNVDVLQDTDIHPPHVCKNCVRKLQRFRTAHNKRKKISIFFPVPSFGEHSDSCACLQFPIKHVKVDDSLAFHAQVQEMGKLNGYQVQITSGGLIDVFKLEPGTDAVICRLTIQRDFTWQYFVQGHMIPFKHPAIAATPSQISKETLEALFSNISKHTICEGISGFATLCVARSTTGPAVFTNSTGEVIAQEEVQGDKKRGTVLHVSCLLLHTNEGKCQVCTHYRGTITTMSKRIKGDAQPSLHQPLRTMTNSQLITVVKTKNKTIKALEQKQNNLKNRLGEAIQQNGLLLEEKQDAGLYSVAQTFDAEMMALPDSSPGKLLWEQQMKALQAKSPTGRRWHPSFVRWCIALHAKSPSAYRLIHNSKFLVLPNEQTLRDYTQYTKPSSGINSVVMNRIYQDIGLEKLDHARNVVLMYDEVRIQSGLVYSRASGQLVGFADLDKMNNDMLNLANPGVSPSTATHVIAFMVRSLTGKFKAVVAHYPTNQVTGWQLYNTIWKVVRWVEYGGLKVRALVSDGATPNRKFYRMHRGGTEELCYYTKHYLDDDRKLYFICDVPHLIKTTRNNWENSHWNQQTRFLRVSRALIWLF